MIVLLSPAKDLAKDVPTVDHPTQPVLLDHAVPLAEKLRTFSAKKLATLMDLSAGLGELNHARYAKWGPPFTTANARPAVFTFNGEVYRGLDARSFDRDDLRFAQQHLRILSGLYGVLRPLDLMQDYRLMMGKPVVATDIAGSGVPWVNVHGCTGLNVAPGSATIIGTNVPWSKPRAASSATGMPASCRSCVTRSTRKVAVGAGHWSR